MTASNAYLALGLEELAAEQLFKVELFTELIKRQKEGRLGPPKE